MGGLESAAVGRVAHLARPSAREAVEIGAHVTLDDGKLDLLDGALGEQTEIGGIVVFSAGVEAFDDALQELLFQRLQMDVVRECSLDVAARLASVIADVFECVVDVEIGVAALRGVILGMRRTP